MPILATKLVPWFKTQKQVRQQDEDEAASRQLGESMRVRQLQPVGAKPDGTLLWGHRRLRAAILVGLLTLEVIITDEALTETQVKIFQVTENVHRADLTPYDKWIACAELMCMNPEWKLQDLAAHLRLDPSAVTRILSPSKCIEPVQQALKDGKIGLAIAYAISKAASSEDQAAMLALALNQATRDQLETVRKNRNGAASSVKVTRLRCPLSSGITVQFIGAAVSLESALDAMADLTKELKKAAEQRLDARTVQAVLKDKAKGVAS